STMGQTGTPMAAGPLPAGETVREARSTPCAVLSPGQRRFRKDSMTWSVAPRGASPPSRSFSSTVCSAPVTAPNIRPLRPGQNAPRSEIHRRLIVLWGQVAGAANALLEHSGCLSNPDRIGGTAGALSAPLGLAGSCVVTPRHGHGGLREGKRIQLNKAKATVSQ